MRVWLKEKETSKYLLVPHKPHMSIELDLYNLPGPLLPKGISARIFPVRGEQAVYTVDPNARACLKHILPAT